MAALLATLFLFIPAAFAGNGITLPLHRIALGENNLPENILSTQISVYNSNLFVYEVDVKIGNQTFPLLLDTGSADVWVLSGKCNDLEECQFLKTYTPTSSIVLADESFELNYLLGSVTGSVACDQMTLGAYQVSCQVFGMANRTQALHLGNNGNSGILGMAFPSVAAIGPATGVSFLQNIFSYLDEPDRYFALALGRKSGLDPTSSFSIGELDNAIASDFSGFFFVDVLKHGANDYDYWKIPLLSIKLEGHDLSLSPSLIPGAEHPIAVLDSGTSLVLGPTIDVKNFWDSFGDAARLNPVTAMWEVKCNTAITVSFVLGSGDDDKMDFPLHPEDINWDSNDTGGEWCMGGIQANDKVNSGDWLVGDVFMRNVYVTHHGQNSTHRPAMGLLGMTDSGQAMEAFKKSRGVESTSAVIRIQQNSSDGMHPNVLYAISSGCGFVGGAAITLLVRVLQTRKMRIRTSLT